MNLRLHSHEFLFTLTMNLRLHSMSSYPPLSVPVNLRLHSMSSYPPCQFLWISECIPWVPIPCQWISDCIPMSPYSTANGSQDCIPMSSYSPPLSVPVNLRLHSHEFLFDAYGFKTQTAFHEFLFPANFLWISDCIPMSSYSTAKFLESFGWVPPTSCHPASNVPIETQKNCILARF